MNRSNFLGADRQWTTIDGRMNNSASWNSINWNKIKQIVNRLQVRIVKAVKGRNKNLVRSLQRLLARSFAGKLLAVKLVSENRGKKTTGVDNKLLDSPVKKWRQTCHLNRADYKPQPLKRIYILKNNGKKRPLGIPVMQDRAEQALELLGLDPVSECTVDNHSYGFRKSRSVHDTISACFNALRGKGSAKWIFEGDIKGCFDNLDHERLIDRIPTSKSKLKLWLKSGYFENNMLHPTAEGTPQGGIISPTIANMALDGLQDILLKSFKKQDKVHLIRYADNFIITGDKEELFSKKIKPLVEQFLFKIGLSLSIEKTRISHINKGFDFLGFNIRKYKNKLLIKPAKSNIASVKEKIKGIIMANKTARTDKLIGKLNPVIRGWANHFRHVVSQKSFDKIDTATWKMTW